MVYLRHLLPISALGGLVHVLAALAVVALPVRRPTSIRESRHLSCIAQVAARAPQLLPAMLIANVDGLWLACHRIARRKGGGGDGDGGSAHRPGAAIPSAAALLFAAACTLAILDAAASATGPPENNPLSLPIGLGAGFLASIGRPCQSALCRRAVAKRCSREILSKKLPLPLSSHRFAGFERGEAPAALRLVVLHVAYC